MDRSRMRLTVFADKQKRPNNNASKKYCGEAQTNQARRMTVNSQQLLV